MTDLAPSTNETSTFVPGSKPPPALAKVAANLHFLAQEIGRLAVAQNETSREQRITNLIVRAQLSTDPAEKQSLLAEVRRRMDEPKRRDQRGPTA